MNDETLSPVHVAVNAAHQHLINSLEALRTATEHLMGDFQAALDQVTGHKADLDQAIAHAEDLRQAGMHLTSIAQGVEQLLAVGAGQPPTGPVTLEQAVAASQQVVRDTNDAVNEIKGVLIPGVQQLVDASRG